MTKPREYFESYLDIFEKIVATDNDLFKLNEIRLEIASLVKKTKQFNLFDLYFSEEFYKKLETNIVSDFETNQSFIAYELYNTLGKLLFEFETTDRATDYGTALEIYRTSLPLSTVSKWEILNDADTNFNVGSLFFSMNRINIEIDSQKKYDLYKGNLREHKTLIRYKGKDKSINKKIYNNVQLHFQKLFDNHNTFILDNYPSIVNEFSKFNSQVRIYLIDRKSNASFATKQLNVYPKLEPVNRCIVNSKYIDFFYRFSNIEEIEIKSEFMSLSMFDENKLFEYDFDFSIQTIYFELLHIYLRNASSSELKDFLIYLVKCSLKHVSDAENEDEINIGKKLCKLYLSKTPNLRTLKQALQGKEYNQVAFTNRPDEKTIDFLKSRGIVDYLILNQLGHDHINNQNGEIIHWFIKSKLDSLHIKKPNQDDNRATILIEKLNSCPSGLSGWLEYENICTEIFEYLFADDFRNYKHNLQSYTHDKIFRRDLIVNNNFKDSTSVWGQAKNDFNCNLIVVDFKNYAEPLEQNEFYLPSKYLNLNTGKFGIVVSRNGLGNSAQILQKRMLNLDKELLICLSDSDLIAMIRDKDLNQDPSYRLENQKFALYETI